MVVRVWLCTSLFILFSNLLLAQPLQIVTEEYPPYNYFEDGEVKGVGTEVVKAVLTELGLDLRIQLLPWARAFRKASEEPNVLIYCISRIPEREGMFKWVGVIAPIDFYIFALNQRIDIHLETLDDARRYTLGLVHDDAQDHYFSSRNFTSVLRVNTHEQVMKNLMKKRIDLWPMSEYAANFYLYRNGYFPSDVRKVFHLKDFSSGDQYMAFGAKTSDHVVSEFKRALAAIKEKGIYQKIVDRYAN